MEEYVVGSVANFISNIETPEVKPKKKRLKTKQPVEEDHLSKEKDEYSSDVSKPESKKKGPSELNLTTEKVTVETAVKKGKSVPLEGKFEVKLPKKRKKSGEAENTLVEEDVPDPKRHKEEYPNLNEEPSLNKNEGKRGKRGKKLNQGEEHFENKFNPEDFKKNTVFVGNIPISYDRKKVCKIFCKFGEIDSARIRCIPIAEINMNKKVAAIKKKYNPKRNSLVAYVKYKSEESAKAALKANGMVIEGHHLRVDAAEENKQRDNSKAIFVGGLPFDIEDDELWEFFQNCGNIESVRVIRDSQTSMGKGFGYVNFDSSASVELALELDGQELKKRKINVKRCMKIRNKNKLNLFNQQKSREITHKLLCKKGKKFKEEKKKLKKENKFSTDFQGRTANMKQKKKKKLSQVALRQRKLVKILGAS